MRWRQAVAALLILLAAAEVVRSLGRLDGVIFTGYTQVGEVVLQGGDPYGLRINTWPPFFLFIAAGLALLARISLAGAVLLWQIGSVSALWGTLRLMPRLAGDEPAPLTSTAVSGAGSSPASRGIRRSVPHSADTLPICHSSTAPASEMRASSAKPAAMKRKKGGQVLIRSPYGSPPCRTTS